MCKGRFLCVDFDETLYLHNDRKTWLKNVELLKLWRSRRNKVAIISGRNWQNFQKICPEWEEIADYLVLDNGGVTFSSGGKIDDMVPFSSEALGEVKVHSYAQARLLVYYTPHEIGLEQPDLSELIKVRAWYQSLETLWSVRFYLEHIANTTLQVLPYPRQGYSTLEGVDLTQYAGFLDFVPKDGGKENAINHISEKEHYIKKDVIVVGDDYNDIGMIKEFRGHAMAGAPDGVIEAADRKSVV